MPRFVVIPREDPSVFADLSPSDMQALIRRYTEWSQRLATEGRLALGEKLRDGEGRVLRSRDGAPSATDGPYAETKEIVGGLWIIEADDLDHASRLVADCPHLGYGSLEVREIEEMG